MADRKIAIIHDWLTAFGGAEQVLRQMLSMFPEADLFTICDFLPENKRGFLRGRNVHTSFVQRLPFASRYYEYYLPLMPIAIEQFDLSEYDLIISSSSSIAKGVVVGPRQRHVSYVYSPMRYAWDLQHQYVNNVSSHSRVLAFFLRIILHYLRIWDVRTANGVDEFIVISKFIERRLDKAYRRRSRVIYPPVDIDRFKMRNDKLDYFVTVSRLVPYKKIPLIAETFRTLGHRLVIIGDGPDRAAVETIARGAPNIEYLGWQPDDVVTEHVSNARAFVFAAEEDFGIVMAEAQSCGTPVIAFERGAAGEIVVDGHTGILYGEQTKESLMQAIDKFLAQDRWDALACRENAEKFSVDAFRSQMIEVIDSKEGTFGA